MGVITSIRRNVKNTGRCSVFVDDEFFAACPIDVALALGLAKGLIMTDELALRLRREDRRMVLRQKAYRFATYKPRTRRDVERQLERLEATAEEAGDVLSWLSEFRLIDDRSYAERFLIASRERKPLSPVMARRALLTKGVPEAIVDEVFHAQEDQFDPTDAARRVARKKLRMITSTDAKDVESKLVRFLQYRGYTWDVIRAVLSEWKAGGLLALIWVMLLTADMQAGGDTACGKIRLGDAINQFQPTTLPVLGADGELFLDRKNHPDNQGGTDDPDEVWVTRLRGNQWLAARPAQITAFDSVQRRVMRAEVMFGMSHDGLQALVAGAFGARTDVMSLALFMRDRRDGPYTRVIVLVADLGRNFFATMSEDRQAIILALDRPDGMGDLDLYVMRIDLCRMQFGKPVALGRRINTAGFEGSPWIACDNRTLYYASAGREDRLGKADLYMTRRLDSSWTSWSEPVNLGSCVNTTGDETTISLPCGVSRAFVTSWDAETDRSGVYTADLPKHLLPQPMNELTVRLQDVDGRPLMIAKTRVGITADGAGVYGPCPANAQFTNTSAADGVARLLVAVDSTFWAFASPQSADSLLVMPRQFGSAASPISVDLLALPTNKPIVSIYFEKGQASLTPASFEALESLRKRIGSTNLPLLNLRAYTDASGSRAINEALSRERALVVAEQCTMFVVDADPSRIKTRAYGVEIINGKPVDSDAPESRRVDVYVAPL
ncbi:MAG: hypothetical protein FGM33_06255 [Candidatus Kapabacteria bacterium]|nr:hypothetical protein [Candidatus Kapabacteria bacterium]